MARREAVRVSSTGSKCSLQIKTNTVVMYNLRQRVSSLYCKSLNISSRPITMLSGQMVRQDENFTFDWNKVQYLMIAPPTSLSFTL